MKKNLTDEELEERAALVAIFRFLRWLMPPDGPCVYCGLKTDGSEYYSLYKQEPDDEVVGINAGHAVCRARNQLPRARAPDCDCVLLVPTQVRVVSCGPEHEPGTIEPAPVRRFS